MYFAFDLGNVLVNVDIMRFQSSLGKRYSNLFPLLIDEMYHRQYEIGLVNFNEICRHVHDRLGHVYIQSDIENICLAWNSVIEKNQFMTDLVDEILQSPFNKVAFLSNIGEEHAKYILTLVPQWKKSKQVIHHFSYQVGARKPTKLFYQSFLLQYPEFKSCYFLDDRQENVDMAKELGFESIRFDLNDLKSLELSTLQNIKKSILEQRHLFK